jgi:hypothetical protein
LLRLATRPQLLAVSMIVTILKPIESITPLGGEFPVVDI